MGLKLSNNAIARLASNISSSDTSILLTPGSGVLFPILSSGDYFPATLIKSDGSHEIIKVTTRSTDTLTVVRSQEGTVASAFNANDRIEVRLTASTVETINALAVAALPKAGGTITGDLTMGAGTKIILKGTTDDAFEVTVDPGNPTADRTLTLPDKSGTLATTGDVFATANLAASSVTTSKVADNAITYAKMQNVTAGKVLGRDTSASGVVQELPIAVGASGNIGVGSTNTTTYSNYRGIRLDPNVTPGTEIDFASADGASIYADADGFTIRSWSGTKPIVLHNGGVIRARVTASGYMQYDSGFGSAANAYGCRAWVNFHGVDGSIRGAGNVSSVTDFGATGCYGINFATAMPDVSYAVVGSCSPNTAENSFPTFVPASNYTTNVAPTTTSVRVTTVNTSSGATYDSPFVFAAVFR